MFQYQIANNDRPTTLDPYQIYDLLSGKDRNQKHSHQIVRRESTLDNQLTTTVPSLLKTEISNPIIPDLNLRTIISCLATVYIRNKYEVICDLPPQTIETEKMVTKEITQRL